LISASFISIGGRLAQLDTEQKVQLAAHRINKLVENNPELVGNYWLGAELTYGNWKATPSYGG